ncbi:hypothetical protein BH11MYX4_BH11MYX4_07860 [soil metagenome]
MVRRLALLAPVVLVAACAGESGADAPVVAIDPVSVLRPEGIAPPGPTPTDPCLVLTPAYPPPAAGDVDTGFGCAGVASYGVANLDIVVKAIAVQADDKIVAVGETYNTSTNHHDAWAARFTSAGKLDTTFAAAGIFTKSFTPLGGPTSANAVVVQPSGALVIGGGYYSEGSQNGVGRTAFVLRLLPDGTLDPAFGTAGVVETSAMTYVHALRLQANGSIVAAGETCTTSAICHAAVGRLSGSSGAPDAGFGAAGFATTNLGGAAPANAYGAAVSGNDVVIAGRSTSGAETNAGLARYGAAAIDATFGTNGTASYDTADTETAYAIANIGTGFVFAESLTQAGTDYFMFTRVQANGAAYASFGFLGRFFVTFAGYGAQAYGLAVTPTSQVVAVGSARTSTGHNRMGITRINGNGTLDNTFSDDGFTTISAGGEDAIATSVVLQSTGRIVAGGWSRPSGNGAKKRAVLVRVRND